MNFFQKIYSTLQAFDNAKTGFNHIARREDAARRTEFLAKHLLRRQPIHILHGSMEASKRDKIKNRA